jgi:hypothetical protein
MSRKESKKYALYDGMIIEREFYGRVYKLAVVKSRDSFTFRLGELVFESLTAAARRVCGDETRSISGPQFWRVPLQ